MESRESASPSKSNSLPVQYLVSGARQFQGTLLGRLGHGLFQFAAPSGPDRGVDDRQVERSELLLLENQTCKK